MQFPFGYPTPPTSPSPFEIPKCAVQQQQQHLHQQPPAPIHPCQARFIPPAPEERLGRFLAGTLQLTGILGTGAYGVVYSAIDIKTHVRYAVKTLSKYNPDGTPLDRRQVAFQNREIRLHWLASSHPNVVSMLKIIDDPDCIYVILEYCPEGDLFYNITECGQYVGKDELAKRVFLQILDAVEHCHSQGIYHRDLKPENILVTDQGETVKLADFGLATSSDRSEDYGCGSTFYMSPECLDHTTRRPYYFCAPNDVWSLGVILVNLTCGRNPWKQASFEDSTYRAYTRNQGFLKTILPVTDQLNDILGRIFTRNPDDRITLPELKARILACPKFTEQPPTILPANVSPAQVAPISPPASPEHDAHYVDYEDAIIDDEEPLAGGDEEFDDYDATPLSPASSDGSLSDGSGYLDDDRSSCSSMEDLEDDNDDMCPEPRGAMTPPPQAEGSTMVYDPEAPQTVVGFPSEFVAAQCGGKALELVVPTPVMATLIPTASLNHQSIGAIAPVPDPQQMAPLVNIPVPVQTHHQPQHHISAVKAPAPVSYLHLPYFLDTMYAKYSHPIAAPLHHPVVPFPHQIPHMFACY